MKFIPFVLLFLNTAVFAQSGPDKNLQFSAKAIESYHGFAVEFLPPPAHHFNLEAPSEVNKISTDKSKISEKAEIDKKTTSVKAFWKTAGKACEIEAQLYLCDDKGTYCLPIKRKFSCSKLTGSDSLGSTEKPSGNLTTPMETKLDLFILNDLGAAQAKAKAEKKLLLIDFFGIWCPPCNYLDEQIFSTKQFKKFEKDFVFLKLDADSSPSWELKAKYNVKGYPTVVLAKADTEEILRIVGSRKPAVFMSELKKALKYKNLSLAERKEKARSLKDPEAAFELAEMHLNQEDFSSALNYFTLALKNGNWTENRKNQMLSAQLGLIDELKDSHAQKKLASLLESSLLVFPFGEEALERADKLASLAEELKDEELKNLSYNAKFKNAEYLLKNPNLYKNSELTEADLYATLADLFDNAKDEKKSKDFYLKAYDSYSRMIKVSGLDEKKERSQNLERIYCLYKAGKTEEANKMYEDLQAVYPEEFTFYYSQASLLKESGKLEQALPKAIKAHKYSYGDNLLRSTYLLADIKLKMGNKKEAVSLVKETLNNFKAPEDSRIRTHRYISKLQKLID